MKKTTNNIAKIKDIKKRDDADKAYDKAKGIKQGSKKDMALDKKNKVYSYEYGPKKTTKKGAKNNGY